MQINTEGLAGGSLSWGSLTQKQVGEEAGVDPATLSKIKQGKEGFSAVAAKSVGPIAGYDPANLYLGSQVQSITKRRDAGQIDDGTVLKAVGRVVSTLKADFPDAQIEEDLAKALQNLAAQASKAGATPKSQMETLGRDGSRQRVEKSAVDEAPVPGVYGKLGRNVDGTSKKMQYGK